MRKGYRSELSKETLIYNIQYHFFNDCNNIEECVECVKTLLENFEAKDDRKEE